MKRCPRCKQWLIASEFGVSRARKDGLNLYCKQCIREKTAIARQNLKEYRKRMGLTKKKDRQASNSSRAVSRKLKKLPPIERVLEAIAVHGAHEQWEIVRLTHLPVDEVCDALAHLLLWTRQIRTCMFRRKRLYLAVRQQQVRKDVVQPSFSSVKALMPRSGGRRNERSRAVHEKT